MFGREAQMQYAAMVQMRWRMFINGLRSIHGVLDLGVTGVAWLLYTVMGVGMGLGMGAATYRLVSRSSWQYLSIPFWVVSFLWLMFPLIVASFQEQSDLRILLRFPIRFRSYFLLYSIAGLMEASTLIGALCCLGVWVGIVIARPDLYVWAALGLSVFAIFNILLVRAVFASIDRWLAQRKTREILGAVLMASFVSLLMINSVWNQERRTNSPGGTSPTESLQATLKKFAPQVEAARRLEQWLPPGMGAQTIREAVARKPVAALASLSGLGVWTLLAGMALGGRLKAEYRGQNLGSVPKRSKAGDRSGGWTLGGSGALAAILEKELRALSRTVPLLWALCMPPLIVPFIAGVFHAGNSGDSFPYGFPLSVAYALLGFTGLFYNNLGAEGAGIQLLFLSPTPIRTVLLAKNLLHAILFAVVGSAAGVMVSLRVGIPPFVVLADTAAWLVFALPCNLAVGTIFSLVMPYRINPGRITRPAGAQANSLSATLIQSAVLGVGGLVFWLSWSLHKQWLPLPIFMGLAALACFAWLRILRYADENANTHRELLIAALMKLE